MCSTSSIILLLSLLTLGHSSTKSRQVRGITIPKGCEDKVICDQVPEDYPHELVQDLVRSMNVSKLVRVPRQVSISRNRQGCTERVQIIKPFLVRANKKQKLVLQSDKFQQTMKSIECQVHEEPCFENLLKDRTYSAKCQAVNGYMKLYVYDLETQTSSEDPVVVPIYCNCVVSRKEWI